MKRVPRAIFAINFVLLLAVAGLSWAKDYQPPPPPSSLSVDALIWFRDHSRALLLSAAIGLALTAVLREWSGTFGFRRSTIEQMLDQFAKDQFKGQAKHHRLTVFRLTSGRSAWLRGRLRLVFRSGDTSRKRAALRSIKWSGSYLRPYARTIGARNYWSSAAWRASDRKEECQGMAGLAWEQAFCIASNLPKLPAKAMAHVQDLQSLDETNPIRVYASQANISEPVLLRAMDTYAQHYMGSVIQVNGKSWGVLLLDSEAPKCPFPEKNGGMVAQQFKIFARQLSHVLS